MSTPDEVTPAADIEALEAQLAAAKAAKAEADSAAEAAHPAPQVTSGSSELRDALDNLHKRLAAVEAHLGL